MMLFWLWLWMPQDPSLDAAFRSALENQDKPDFVAIYREMRPEGPRPQDESILDEVGYFLMRGNKPELARDVFELNLVLFPNQSNPFDSLAGWHFNQNQLERAIFYWEQAYARQPNRGVWQQIGRVLNSLGDSKRLLEHGRQTVARYDDFAAHDGYLATRVRFTEVANGIKQLTDGEARFAPHRFFRSRRALEERGLTPPAVIDGWRTGEYAEKGLDPRPFSALVERARKGEYPNLEGVVVAQGNTIIGEAYFGDFSRHRPHDTRSVGKSITALVVGIAADQGKLKLDDRFFDFFPEYRREKQWQAEKDQVQVRHLLGMSSGLDAFDNNPESPGNENTFQQKRDGWEPHLLRLPMAFKPGSKLVYASANYALLGALVNRATHKDLAQLAAEKLFGPLGIANVKWFRTPAGKAYGAGGVRMTPRDLAKIGRLILEKGRWGDQRIISAEWIRACTTPQFEGKFWGKSYGFGWYHHQVTSKGRAIEVISAAGNGGQRIWVMPELKAVAVITMGNYNSRKQLLADEILAEVLVPSLIKD